MSKNIIDIEDRIITVENTAMEAIWSIMKSRTKEYYTHGEIFGQFCNVNQYINVPVDFAYAYLSNIKNLEEWTFSVRSLKPIGGVCMKGLRLLLKIQRYISEQIATQKAE